MADFGIFQAWAEASGAYTPGKDKPDLSTWKRNFRSALNRKEVLRLAEDRSKDPFDPHKVYEFVTPGAARDFVHLDTSPDTNGKSSLSDHQEDLLELLDDMALGPLPDEGSSDLPIASDPSQLPLSPIVNNFPNPAPQENPLRQLLAEERECLLWGRKGCSRDCGPYLVLFISPLPSSSTPVLRVGVRGDCLLPRPPGLPADTLLPRGPAAGGQHI